MYQAIEGKDHPFVSVEYINPNTGEIVLQSNSDEFLKAQEERKNLENQ